MANPSNSTPVTIYWRRLPRHCADTGFVGIPYDAEGAREDEVRFYIITAVNGSTIAEGKFLPEASYYQPGLDCGSDWCDFEGDLTGDLDTAKAWCQGQWEEWLGIKPTA